MTNDQAHIHETLQEHDYFLDILEQEIQSESYQSFQELIRKGPHPSAEQLYDYVAKEQNDKETRIIEDHLEVCALCAEEVLQIRLIEAEFEESLFQTHSEEITFGYSEKPLAVTSVSDRNTPELIHHYYRKPLMEELAASTSSSESSGELIFPITVKYEGELVVGQFWRRAGYLFYRLKKKPAHFEHFVCMLEYTPPTVPSEKRIFTLHEGEDKRLGELCEFITSNTKQNMLDAMRQFKLFLKPKE